MFVSIMAFFAKISDPVVGGTYMTLLNTLTNLGGNWPSTLALWIIGKKLALKKYNEFSQILPQLCNFTKFLSPKK